jgi:branched-chain amino acid transport system substrate-binding protein
MLRRFLLTICRLLPLAAGLAVAVSLAPAASAEDKEPIKIGFGMALTGGLAGNGKAALIAMQLWEEDINKHGGLLGRPVRLVYYDDQTNPATVPGIYSKLLDVDKVDLVVSGYGTNLIAPAMPIVMQRNLAFMTLFGLDVNAKFGYDRFFQIMPAGPDPAMDWTSGFFAVAAAMKPKPQSIALVGADAEYSSAAVGAARKHAQAMGLKIVYDKSYPANTVEFAPIISAIQAVHPDIVYVGSYPPDSAGMIRAANEAGLKTGLFGGGMVGTQYAAMRTQLGPLLNGVVSYEFYAPEAAPKLPSVAEFLTRYQQRAATAGVDPLGYYLPPYAYAMMQVVAQSVEAVGSLDQTKLSAYMHDHTFDTLIGNAKFAKNGEWATSRVLTVQYHGVSGNGLDQWKKPGSVTILYPSEYETGTVRAPFQDAKGEGG